MLSPVLPEPYIENVPVFLALTRGVADRRIVRGARSGTRNVFPIGTLEGQSGQPRGDRWFCVWCPGRDGQYDAHLHSTVLTH